MKVASRWLMIVALFVLTPAAFAVQRVILKEDVKIHRSPDPSSEVLGSYRKGMTIQVSDRDQNGYHSLSFSRPVKGATQGWVEKDKLQFGVAATRTATTSSRSRSAPGQFKPYSIGPMLRMFMFNPSVYGEISGVTSSSVMSPGFGLQAGYMLSQSFGINFSLLLFSLAKTIAGKAATGFFASGPIAVFGGDYYLVRGSFDVSIGAGLGATMAKAGMYNPSTGSKVETSSITGILFMGKLGFSKRLGSSLGLKLDAGYQMLNLKDVPFLLLADQDGTADFQLSAPFFGLSVQYLF